MLEAQGDEGASRLENLGQLISSVKTYADQKGEEATLAGFLEEVALISDLDSYDEENDVVVMMTMHSAKGLNTTMCLSSVWRRASSPATCAASRMRSWRRSAGCAMWASPGPRRSCISLPARAG